MGLISTLLLVLVAGALLIWVLPVAVEPRRVALLVLLATLGLAGMLVGHFDASAPGFQFQETVSWIPSLGVNYQVGVDGLSLLFLPVTLLVFLGAVIYSWDTAGNLPRLYFSLLLLQAAATLGVFVALDTILFFLFWELSLVPLYLLISLWGVGASRRQAATLYSLIMLASGVPLLFAFLLLAFQPGLVDGTLAFDMQRLLAHPVRGELGYWVFFLMFAGFAAKTPLFPLHTWMPVTAMAAPVAVTALLTGLKLGGYGLLRFVVPLAPQAAQELHWLLAGLGTLGLLYGALAALAQTNLRQMLAYASVSHVGLVVLGIASFNLQGYQGAALQLLNFAITSGGMMLLAAALYQRTGTEDIQGLAGAVQAMPLLSGLFLVLGLGSLGVPGTSGFPAELLILIAALNTHTGAGLAALFAMVIGAGYFLALYRRLFLGPIRSAQVGGAEDLRPHELAVAVVMVGLLLGVGLYPAPILELMRPAGEAWLLHLR